MVQSGFKLLFSLIQCLLLTKTCWHRQLQSKVNEFVRLLVTFRVLCERITNFLRCAHFALKVIKHIFFHLKWTLSREKHDTFFSILATRLSNWLRLIHSAVNIMKKVSCASGESVYFKCYKKLLNWLYHQNRFL